MKRSQYWIVSPKRVEARRVAAGYFFSRRLVLQAPDLDGMDDACVWNEHYFIHSIVQYTKLEGNAPMRFHGLSILMEAHL